MRVAPAAAPITAEETTTSRPPGRGQRRLLPMVAVIGGLGSLAVAQPVLELIRQEPGFLVAQGLGPTEIVLLPVLLVAGPLLAGLLIGLVSGFAPRTGKVLAGAALAVSGAAIALQLGRRLPFPAGLLAALALVAGGSVAFAFSRYESVRSAGRYLLIVPVVVVAWFLVALPPSLRAGAAGGWPTVILELDQPAPVVVLILDELPVTSLMDAHGGLLADRFPSFARLAADGVWYRNAVTVETSTQRAVPAILTGKRVGTDLVPTVADHPQSLFTLLSLTHEVRAVESVTDLCPKVVCAEDEATIEETIGRWRRLAGDLIVVYGHVTLPRPWTAGLAPIDQGWTNFGRNHRVTETESFDLMDRVAETVEGDRRADVERFLTALTPDETEERPQLTVGHLVLPHRPWEYLPDGSPHGEVGPDGYNGLGWGSDPYFTAAGWRRHLLQLGLVDKALGRVVDRLRELGTYDSTLVVVVADHGVMFESDVGDMRVTRPESVGWILPVPLFVKYPDGLGAGTITDVRAETTDIVPTILDVLGADVPDDLAGASLLGPTPATRSDSRVLVRDEWLTIPADLGRQLDIARQKESWFPGGDVWALVPEPALRSLLGRSLTDVEASDSTDVYLRLAPRGSGTLVVGGSLEKTSPPTGDELVVLVGGGNIVAVTRVFDIEDNSARFSFLLDPDDPASSGTVEAWLLEGPTTLRR